MDKSTKTAQRRHKRDLVQRNVHIVLEYGNVTPFMWTRSNYLCFYCKAAVQDPDELRQHVANMHQVIDLENILRDRIGNTGDSEVPVKLDVKDISCRLCITPIANLPELIDHLNDEHEAGYDTTVKECLFAFELGKEKLKCSCCDMQFNYFEYLLRHANKHHINHNFICSVCGKTFHKRTALVSHFNDYHKELGYPCEICNKVYKTAAQRYGHKKNSHFIDHLKCPYCPEICKSKYYQKLHLAKVHGDEDCKHECPHCKKMFPLKGTMLSHVRRVHYKERNVECEVCGYRFFNKAHLDAHSVMHSGGTPCFCDVCGKSFARKGTLKTHIKLHANGRVKV